MEECDDANWRNDDRCVGDCRLARCGDGYVYTGVEECDDGNTTNGDWCSSTCARECFLGGLIYPDTGHCYILIRTSLRWWDANNWCQNYDSYLVTITSPGENDFVRNLVDFGANWVWIGFNDRWSEGVWSWETTFEFPVYTRWATVQPDNQNWDGDIGADCGVMRNASTGQWWDEDCGDWLYFVCEHEY